MPSSCLLTSNKHTFAISKWVSPKRTRSYPFERVFNTLHISKKIKDEFAIQPTRWVVERTFSWLNNYRRLSKDYEITAKSASNFIKIAMIRLTINHLNS